ncbi:MAG TPA: hypothetical protein VII66_11015 [Gemmatimonadaceae bacterium]
MRKQIIVGVTVTPLLLIVACQRVDNTRMVLRDQAAGSRNTTHMSGDSLMIRTTDGAINLGLANDTVFMGLSDSVLAVARSDMARDTEEKQNAFAGTIERFVKKSVGTALQMRVKYALADLDSATYRNGAIRFAYRDRRRMAFENVSQDGHKALESFSPADAQKFVDTVNSAIRAERGNF